MKRIRSATVNGKRCGIEWRKLGREKAAGQAYYQSALMEIDPRMTNYNTAEILTHEYIHMALPDLCEEKVEQMGVEIIKLLDRTGLIKRDEDE